MILRRLSTNCVKKFAIFGKLYYTVGRMEFIAKTFSYLKKSFPLLAAVMLVPATALAVLVKPFGFVTAFPSYMQLEIRSFGDVAWLLFDKYATVYVYPYIVAFIAATLGISLALAVIENHFRVGRIKFSSAARKVNNCLWPAFISFGFITVLFFVWQFLLTCVITLLHIFISGGGYATVADFITTGVVSVALFCVWLYLMKSAFIWAPMMLVYGYSFVDTVIESASAVSKAPFKFYFGLFLPFAVVVLLEAAVGMLGVPVWGQYLINTAVCVFLLAYTVAYIMVATFRLTGMERRDLKKLY